ncbi:MAG: hypothetical protein R3335_11940 [Anaerolineales bacterium]|nr:hypothetical protein [Anaerolineales bacterium]
MDNKITIIEGPTPTFEVVRDEWVVGLIDSPVLAELAVTRLRTFNGAELVRRCYNAWREHETMYLEYRGMDGLPAEVPIVAARFQEVDEGQMLELWVQLEIEDIEIDLDYGDDFGDLIDDEEL